MTPDISDVERFTGNYSVTGRTPDGRDYRGPMRLERRGAFLHAEATLDPLGTRVGLAMPFAGRLVMAFGARDKVEIGAYRIEGANVHGMWVPPGATDTDFARCGREESTREASDPNLWMIRRAHAVDQSAYTGTVRLTPTDPASANPNPAAAADRPTPVKMTWNLHDGEYHSFALAYDDAVYSTFNLERGQPNGLVVYEVAGARTPADELSGRWLAGGEIATGSESLRRSPRQ